MIEKMNRRSCAFAVALVSALGAGLAACEEESKPTAETPAARTFAETECAACVGEACESELSACRSDPGCAAYLDCVGSCPVNDDGVIDSDCDVGCAPDTSSEATRAQAELYACRNYGAGTSCQGCGEQPPSQPVGPQQCEPRAEPAPTPCRACYWEKCCATWDACYAPGVNPECDALGTCISMCTPPLEDCSKACMDAHPGAIGTLFDQVACAVENCALDTDNCNPAEREGCDLCAYGTCGAEFTALNATPDGYLLSLCMGDCYGAEDDIACLEGCFAAHPDGEYAGYLWAECVAYYCEASC